MSDEIKRTQVEIDAGVEKLLADTKKTEAETEKLKHESRKAEAEALTSELSARASWRKREREKASDEENHLYRFSGSVGTASVHSCMVKLTEWSRLDPKCKIEIVFSSPGGSIVDGFELFDFIQDLRSSGHQITTGTLGMAASMAGILLQAGDIRWVGHQAWVMIHRAHFGAIGKTFEVEDEVEFVKRIEERILDIFTTRSKLTKRKIKRNWDRKDWWISADEALELRLVDEIRAMLPESKPKPDVKKRTSRRKKNESKRKGKK